MYGKDLINKEFSVLLIKKVSDYKVSNQ